MKTMNAQHGSTQALTQSHARTSGASDIRLRGPWLVTARVGWVTITLIDLLIFVLSIPAYFAELHVICSTANLTCDIGQITPGNALALTHLGISREVYIAYILTITLLTSLLFLTVGAIIFWHKSQELIGLLISLLLITFGCCGSTLELVGALSAAHPDWVVVQIISQVAFIIYPALGMFFCLFPDGRFVPHWSWLLIGLWILSVVFFAAPPDSPFSIGNWPPVLFASLLLLLYGSGLGVQIYRYRSISRPEQRQQTKWFVFLRSHLWDIDVLIHRTLVYGLLTTTLLVVYLVLVVGGQDLLASFFGPSNGVVLVVSTLIVAALFQPLRQRVQQLVDRRFYRRKYDTQKTLAAFSTVLRGEVDLDQLREQLLAVVEETMQPAHLSLWIRPVKQQASGGGIRGEFPSPVEERPRCART